MEIVCYIYLINPLKEKHILFMRMKPEWQSNIM